MIRFKYNPFKAVQAVALFLELHDKPMNYMSLLKLMYMADRLALQSGDQSISGDNYCAMSFGPVLSNIYNHIKGVGKQEDQEIWEKYISTRDPKYQTTKNYNVRLLVNPGDGELSEEEVDTIKGVYTAYGKLDRFYLADFTHQYFPEWEDPNPAKKVAAILIEDVLKNVGKTPEEIEEIEQEIAQEDYLDMVLSA
jgi:uncharacterized phage-associated protein